MNENNNQTGNNSDIDWDIVDDEDEQNNVVNNPNPDNILNNENNQIEYSNEKSGGYTYTKNHNYYFQGKKQNFKKGHTNYYKQNSFGKSNYANKKVFHNYEDFKLVNEKKKYRGSFSNNFENNSPQFLGNNSRDSQNKNGYNVNSENFIKKPFFYNSKIQSRKKIIWVNNLFNLENFDEIINNLRINIFLKVKKKQELLLELQYGALNINSSSYTPKKKMF